MTVLFSRNRCRCCPRWRRGQKLESKLDDNLADLKDFYHTVEKHVDSLSPDVLTASDLEVLIHHGW